jgi:hypothetical protein
VSSAKANESFNSEIPKNVDFFQDKSMSFKIFGQNILSMNQFAKFKLSAAYLHHNKNL